MRNIKKQFSALWPMSPQRSLSRGSAPAVRCGRVVMRQLCTASENQKFCQMLSCIILSFHPFCRSTPSSTVGRRTHQGRTLPVSPSPTMASLWLHVEVRTIFFLCVVGAMRILRSTEIRGPSLSSLRANRLAVGLEIERWFSGVWWSGVESFWDKQE